MGKLKILTPTDILLNMVENNEILFEISNFINSYIENYSFTRPILTEEIGVPKTITERETYILFSLYKRFGWKIVKKSQMSKGGKIFYSFEISERTL